MFSKMYLLYICCEFWELILVISDLVKLTREIRYTSTQLQDKLFGSTLWIYFQVYTQLDNVKHFKISCDSGYGVKIKCNIHNFPQIIIGGRRDNILLFPGTYLQQIIIELCLLKFHSTVQLKELWKKEPLSLELESDNFFFFLHATCFICSWGSLTLIFHKAQYRQ